jgi:hypothetical protein
MCNVVLTPFPWNDSVPVPTQAAAAPSKVGQLHRLNGERKGLSKVAGGMKGRKKVREG